MVIRCAKQDAAGTTECNPLLIEHTIACSAIEAMKKSGLGRVL